MKQALGQSLFIVFVASVLSLASYGLRPDILPWDRSGSEIDLDSARKLDSVIWIDARTEEDFQEAHLDGALLLNEESWESGFVELLATWVPGTPVVVYCSSQSCLRSHNVAMRLREELGVEEVYSLHGGWESLLAEGLAQ